jgi:hypothetical protein
VAGLKTFLETTFMQPPYRQPAPSVFSVSPAAGPASAGTPVTITGANFSGSGWATTAVFFSATPAASCSVSSAGQIAAVVPAGSGLVDVSVRTTATSDGYAEASSTSSADQFAYAPVPVVSAISPAKGPTKGGTSVTITGSGFTGAGFSATSVSLGGTPAASFSVSSPTTIVAVTPSSRSLQTVAVAVTVTTPGGTSAGGAASSFTFTRK